VIAIIPALNAERTLAKVVEDAKRQLEHVLVIDDGSSDRTSDVAREAGAIVLRHDVNRGKGGALKTGFTYALEHNHEAVITLDADGQHLPGEIPKFVDAWSANHADLIIGGRAHLFQHMLPRRRNANRFSAWCISKAAGVPVADSQSGFRLYSAKLLRAIDLHTDGFDMESEVIVRAGRRGFRVVSISIELGFVDGVATSHYKPLMDTLRIAWTVTRARLLW
jgi:glycosyltransferase involved in cell wall biosynthesis